MKLRPHHLLCTQGYVGKGYDAVFVKNMTAITSALQNNTNKVVEIVFATDDICNKCPKKIKKNLCADNSKVKLIDEKVISYFGLEERSYNYQTIIYEINAKMTSQIMDDICGDCSWYPIGVCKRRIIGHK